MHMLMVCALCAVLMVACQPIDEGTSARLTLATTTSTQDSGLLDFILPHFEEATGVDVDVIGVGTGQALRLGEDGNADVVLVHAPAAEDAFMDAGHGIRREDVMYNDFVVLGPPDDPAGLRGIESAVEGLRRIALMEVDFVSRGDESGTHVKERELWQDAGIMPGGNWYIAAGQGMGAVLTMAMEQQAYTLSDRATYLAHGLARDELVIVLEGDPSLFNPYGVIAVNPAKSPAIQEALADQFIDWLISEAVQAMIREYGVEEFGQPLFVPMRLP